MNSLLILIKSQRRNICQKLNLLVLQRADSIVEEISCNWHYLKYIQSQPERKSQQAPIFRRVSGAPKNRHRIGTKSAPKFSCRLKIGTNSAPFRRRKVVFLGVQQARFRRVIGAKKSPNNRRLTNAEKLVPKSHRIIGDDSVPFLRQQIGAKNRNAFTRTNMQ